MHTHTDVHLWSVPLELFVLTHRYDIVYYCNVPHTIASTHACTHTRMHTCTHTHKHFPQAPSFSAVHAEIWWLENVYDTWKAGRSMWMISLTLTFICTIVMPFTHQHACMHTFLPSWLAHDWLTGMAGVIWWGFFSVHVICFCVEFIALVFFYYKSIK